MKERALQTKDFRTKTKDTQTRQVQHQETDIQTKEITIDVTLKNKLAEEQRQIKELES